MLNLSKREYFLSLSKPLRKKGFQTSIKDNKYIFDSYIALTLTNKIDYFQVKIKRKWFHYFGNYNLLILCSNIKLLDEIEKVNNYAKGKTSDFNFEKRKFHDKLSLSITNLKKEYKSYLLTLGGIEAYQKQIQKLKNDTFYEEKLTVYDFISPAIGLEIDEKGIHPVFGIAVGGDRSGGLILFDPFERQLEIGGYLGFGSYGIYDSFEFEFLDSLPDIDISWDWD